MDLVVVSGGTKLLLRPRNNSPAKDFWFCGVRSRPNEPMQAAPTRVALDKLGLDVDTLHHSSEHMVAFEHFYHDRFAGDALASDTARRFTKPYVIAICYQLDSYQRIFHGG